MWHCLATIEPLDTTSGLREAVHVASADLKEICSLNSTIWEPAMLEPPSLALRTWNGDFGDSVGPGAMSMALALEVLTQTYPDAQDHDWSQAPVTLYVGKVGTAWPWTTMFKGRIRDYENKERKLAFRAEVDTEPFDADVLTATYAGTGGAEGGDDIKGQVKPLILGWAKNVEPVLINAVNSVYQFSGYGPIEAVTTLFERASDFGASQGDYADYAALVAATIPPGRWATCLDEGLVRLGAPAFGVITGDVKGHEVSGSTPRLTGAMIDALADIAGVSGSLIESATLTAMDADKPYNGNIVVTDQTSFIDLARRLVLDCNHQACISLTGQLFVTKPDLTSTADLTLNAQGRALPQVKAADESSTSAPYSKFVFGADRCWRVQDINELAGGYTPKGLYDATAFYKKDEWVFAPSPDGRAFRYTNATPGAGHALPTHPDESNTHWAIFGAADVTATAVPRHEPADSSLSFTANYQGALDGGQLPKTVSFKRYRGGTDVSASATWSIVSQGSITGGTVTVTDGLVSIPEGVTIPLSTTITVRNVRDDFTLNSQVLVTRSDAAAPVASGGGGGSGGGTSVSDPTLSLVDSTTSVAVSDLMTVKTGSAGTITFAGLLGINVAADAPTGTFGVSMQWKYRPVGGSFSNVGSAIAHHTAATVALDPESGGYVAESGGVNVSASQTGLSATTDYEVQLWGARSSSSPTKNVFFAGTASATGS